MPEEGDHVRDRVKGTVIETEIARKDVTDHHVVESGNTEKVGIVTERGTENVIVTGTGIITETVTGTGIVIGIGTTAGAADIKCTILCLHYLLKR